MSDTPKGNYKPTGCLAVDMVAACKTHYESQGGKVLEVYLCRPLWRQFNAYLMKQVPGHVDTGGIDFDDTIVRKASIISLKKITWVLEKRKKIYASAT